MPLHTDDAMLGVFDRLEQAVGRMADGSETLRQTIDALMVERGTPDAFRSGGAGQPAGRLQRDFVQDELCTDGELPWRVGNERICVIKIAEVLDQRSTEEHVGQLHPATYGKYRQPTRQGGTKHRRFESILVGRHAVYLRRCRLSVQSGIDVGATHQNECVEATHQLGCIIVGKDLRCKDHRLTAGAQE